MLVDVSHVIENGMITYRGFPAPLICDFLSREQSRSLYAAGTEFQIGKIEMVANTGTYLEKTRQGVRALRPTRPAGPGLHLAEPHTDGPTRDDHLDFAPWHAPQESCLRILARQGTRRTETVVVVTVRRHIVVTVGRTHVRRLIVERAATQHTATRSSPSGS